MYGQQVSKIRRTLKKSYRVTEKPWLTVDRNQPRVCLLWVVPSPRGGLWGAIWETVSLRGVRGGVSLPLCGETKSETEKNTYYYETPCKLFWGHPYITSANRWVGWVFPFSRLFLFPSNKIFQGSQFALSAIFFNKCPYWLSARAKKRCITKVQLISKGSFGVLKSKLRPFIVFNIIQEVWSQLVRTLCLVRYGSQYILYFHLLKGVVIW